MAITMSLDNLWHLYQEHGYTGVRDSRPAGAEALFYLALLAFGEDDLAHALGAAYTAAHAQPENPVYVQGAAYLDRVLGQGKAGVYVDGEAFAAFIRGGGNVGLYAACSEALRAVYGEYDALRVLDIGVGDGLALLPALTGSITRLDLVEPSDAMLARTAADLDRHGVPYTAHNVTLQEFMQSGPGAHWNVIQATYSLQSIPPEDRPAAFAWMRAHADRVLIAEFDVPDFEALYHPARVRYVLNHYRHGLAEYADDGGLVAQGFLMPVMFGYFDRSAARTNWEGPLAGWVDGLRAAGFHDMQTHLLYAYWWAESHLIDAR
jgi:hypothetical protein